MPTPSPTAKTFNDILLDDFFGATPAQTAAINGGSSDLLAKAIKCYDQESHVYDLTMHFIDEYKTFPFGQFKDLIDATSRIYDMQPSPPAVLANEATEPRQYYDR